jgi:alpha-L-fucosidase
MKTHPWLHASKAKLQASPAGERRFAGDAFGMSVHFGLYSTGAEPEWTQSLKNLPTEEYAVRMDRFNPEGFDADRWIELAAGAGARAFMVTTKHHDGFCLFDSRHTDFKSTCAPIERDLVGELAEACHRRDVSLHLYHSLIDWHHPMASGPDFGPPHDFKGYCGYLLAQVEELCRNYGPVAGMLFDGWWPAAKASVDQTNVARNDPWPLTELYDLIHRLQPDAMITNNHHVLPLPGEDYQVWEIDMPGENTTGFNCTEIGDKAKMAWITSTANAWCWQRNRDDYKTAAEVAARLAKCREIGATMFLNVGPMGDGEMNPREIEILEGLPRARKLGR